ncbi:ParB/RepB/Spo0J family partition protein [Paracoccus ravus]|uniref:ParB/RepB/Spo0J family partition protein n=1 Tax=Paracoccus ravus TaxID=2447760 RepID=UPI00106E2336|nr:ParB N-terminal domain-containing protein [Paracoccus ravus]
MAKRRRLETPSTADINRIEQEFRSETFERPAIGRGIAPIAQVVAESASLMTAESAETRTARAKADADAARLKLAEERGLLISEIPLDQIDEAAMVRDRMVVGEEEMQELRLSIAAHGLRLPIEVFEIDSLDGQKARFGLLSGFRRLEAMRALRDLSQSEKYNTIPALIRPRSDSDEAFVAMVEENEVRQELSHFERGRIAVIAANQGAFANTDDAVAKLFATASKAKRSKVRSFALIFEELGDMLSYPEALTERRGLRISAALRNGGESQIRDALSTRACADAEEEWALIEPVLHLIEEGPSPERRVGRPKSKPARLLPDLTAHTTSGILLRVTEDRGSYVIRLDGEGLNADVIQRMLAELVQF